MVGPIYSTHVWYEDLAVVGRCQIGFGRFVFSLWHRWSGELLASWAITPGHPDWAAVLKNWRLYVGKFIRRLEAGENVDGKPVAAFDPEFTKKFPAFAEHVSLASDDGRPRATTTVLLMVELGRWKACIRDRDNDLVSWVTADAFKGLLEAIEDRLSGKADPDWRADKFPTGRRGRK